jgi:large subunit ribosomal protein L25
MDKLILTAEPRTERGKAAAKLRAKGIVPAVAYGRKQETEAVSIDARELTKAYHKAGGNKLVDLKIGDGKARSVLIHDVQTDVRTGALVHADLYLVRMDETLRAEVPLHFVGESTAVYQAEGTLMKNLEMIEVECLPKDLPESIEVDISVLDDFDKTITVADLAVPEGVKLHIEDTETLVAKVEPPRSDEEMAELDAELGDTVPEGARDEEEGGEAAPEGEGGES